MNAPVTPAQGQRTTPASRQTADSHAARLRRTLAEVPGGVPGDPRERAVSGVPEPRANHAGNGR